MPGGSFREHQRISDEKELIGVPFPGAVVVPNCFGYRSRCRNHLSRKVLTETLGPHYPRHYAVWPWDCMMLTMKSGKPNTMQASEIVWNRVGDVSRKKMICIKNKKSGGSSKRKYICIKKIFQGTRALMLQGICSILKNLAGHQKEN